MWTVAAGLIALAAEQETGGRARASLRPRGASAGSPRACCCPSPRCWPCRPRRFGIWLAGSLTPWDVAFFAIFFAVILLLVFGRQAYLLVDNRRAIVRERTLSHEMGRRNQDLEALTGLASTMTQTLEETPIMERGLETLRLAARASSAALHLAPGRADGRRRRVAGRARLGRTAIASPDGARVREDARRAARLPLPAVRPRQRDRHGHADARGRRRLRRRGGRAPGAAGQPARDRHPERARLPREAGAGASATRSPASTTAASSSRRWRRRSPAASATARPCRW